MTISVQKSDVEIQKDVLAEFTRDWRFKPAEVGIEVDEGVVTLTGTVSSYSKVIAAGELAAGVVGVRDVANALHVHVPGISLRDDTDIAKAARSALEWDAEVPEERIDSIVREGVVTLRGTVDHWYQRRAATRAIGHLTGVRAVRNEIEVVPPKRSDLDIRTDVREALQRRLGDRAGAVDIRVEEGSVTLSGRVHSFADRQQAELAAWSTPGVHGVVNEVFVHI